MRSYHVYIFVPNLPEIRWYQSYFLQKKQFFYQIEPLAWKH